MASSRSEKLAERSLGQAARQPKKRHQLSWFLEFLAVLAVSCEPVSVCRRRALSLFSLLKQGNRPSKQG
jgi:hypothetical protein